MIIRAGLVSVAVFFMHGFAHAQNARDFILTCSRGALYCASSKQQFTEEYPHAWRGNYQAQRNVALCFHDGCDGAVMPNSISACAWRVVILHSNHRDVDDGDRQWVPRACAGMTPVAKAKAKEMAESMIQRIYRRAETVNIPVLP